MLESSTNLSAQRCLALDARLLYEGQAHYNSLAPRSAVPSEPGEAIGFKRRWHQGGLRPILQLRPGEMEDSSTLFDSFDELKLI